MVTGAAGFVGFHVSAALLAAGHEVVGHDDLCDYYDPLLKAARIRELERFKGWSFVRGDLADAAGVHELVRRANGGPVVHLGGQAGVRWSIENPQAYVRSNLIGFANVLEACRQSGCSHLVYASSSSVYGLNEAVPFDASRPADHPVSFYAATKKANEAMAHSYAELFGIPTTGLRFFSVYGPWGRPDMAYWKFTEAILSGNPVEVFGGGVLERDYTYIDDVVTSIVRITGAPAKPDAAWSGLNPDCASSRAPWRIYNIGNRTPVSVNKMLSILEGLCGQAAKRIDRGKPPGDVDRTWSNVEPLERDHGFTPDTPLETGLGRFVDWFRWWRSTRGGHGAGCSPS